MSDKKEFIPLEEAVKGVEGAMIRVALLHLSFSKILIEQYGEKRGIELTIKSIMEYGKRINEIVNRGWADVPRWGLYLEEPYQDEEGRYVVSGCILARVFKHFNELNLGRLYCYVDAARSMSSDPTKKLVHITCEACGDDQCIIEFVPTTEEERKQFVNRDNNWKYVDPRLIQE